MPHGQLATTGFANQPALEKSPGVANVSVGFLSGVLLKRQYSEACCLLCVCVVREVPREGPWFFPWESLRGHVKYT